ncbi:MAG: hypothetical protein ACQEQF_03790 [Bacillota bacterium]
MKKLSTFEDIFNKLIKDYINQEVEIESKQNGLKITKLKTKIKKIEIIPLNKRKSKKWCKSNKKVGLIKITGRKLIKSTVINIPFLLGFNTMEAHFTQKGVHIKTYNMEFVIRKKTTKKQSA